MAEVVKQDENKIETPKRRRYAWPKGVSGNPKGRPQKAEIDKLRQALEYGEKKHGKDIFYHAIDRAWVNDQVLIALLKKLVPDMIKGEGFIEPSKIFIIRDAFSKAMPKDTDNLKGTDGLSVSPNPKADSRI